MLQQKANQMNKYSMKVEKIEDQPDGSALITFDIPIELSNVFVQHGLKKVLVEAAVKAIIESNSVDIIEQLKMMQDETGIAMAAASEIEILRQKVKKYEDILYGYGDKSKEQDKSSY
jgi:nitrous oxidase accessory protein NosD